MIFGGENHDVYLGCLSCSEYDADSVHNAYGKYGNYYNAISIHNNFGKYGSAYSSLSACNAYANNPPVVVDKDGHFYGYLTVNGSKSKAISEPEIRAWIEEVCRE